MKKMSIIKGDWNDGDYVTREMELKTDEDVQMIKDIAAAAATMKRHDEIGKHELLKKYHPDIIWDALPNGPDGAEIHTLKSIRIMEIANDEILYSHRY